MQYLEENIMKYVTDAIFRKGAINNKNLYFRFNKSVD